MSEAHTFSFDRGIATLVWPEFDVSVMFDRFHEDRRSHDVAAEMSCFAGSNGAPELLHRARLNLGSTQARTAAAKFLTGRREEVDWAGLLEQCAWQVLDAFRRGRGPVVLRDVVVDETVPRVVIAPLLAADDPVILFGDGGSAKSMLGLALAMSVESGIPYADLHVSQSLRAAYLDFEWQATPHRRRMQALCGGGELPSLVYIPCGAEGPLSAQVERLQRIIHERSIEYVFIDSVALACAGPPEEAGVCLDFFQALTRLNVGACLLAHINRGGDEERPFGSTFWHNSARSTWFLEANQEPGTPRLDLALTNRKSNDGPKAPSFALHFEFEPNRTTIRRADLASIPELAGTLPLKDRIRPLLKAGPRTVADIAEHLAAEPDTVRTTLKRMSGRLFVQIPDSNPIKWGLAGRTDDRTPTGQPAVVVAA